MPKRVIILGKELGNKCILEWEDGTSTEFFTTYNIQPEEGVEIVTVKGIKHGEWIHLLNEFQKGYGRLPNCEDIDTLQRMLVTIIRNEYATEIITADDPNIKCGPEGNVLPSQELNYKVEYENEGEGIAFGVYFTDTLDEDLDDSTLEIGPVISTLDGSEIASAGSYNPGTRTITWLVGEVRSGEGGYANFSVNVRSEAPEGTEIINFATVYFPSVPETTRTNGIVSIVSLNLPPVADANGPYIIFEGSPVIFNVSGSYDPDVGDHIVSWNWDLDGDGEFDDASGEVVNYTWFDDYSGDISLKVTDSFGAIDVNNTTVTVLNVPPTANISVESPFPTLLENDAITFNGSATDSGIYDSHTYVWDFGDWTNTTGQNVTHAYSIAETYTVTLNVTDDDGASDKATVIVTVERHSYEMSIRPTSSEVKPGETATYAITIDNTGTLKDTYNLALTTDISSAWINFPVTTVFVLAGSSENMSLEFTPPEDLPLMENTTYNFTVQATCTHTAAELSNAPLIHHVNGTLTVEATKRSMSEYIDVQLEELKNNVSESDIQQDIKNSLLSKIENATEKQEQGLEFIKQGKEKQANNMLSACENILNAFVNEVEAQRGKKIAEDVADRLIQSTQEIIESVYKAIAMPMG